MRIVSRIMLLMFAFAALNLSPAGERPGTQGEQ